MLAQILLDRMSDGILRQFIKQQTNLATPTSLLVHRPRLDQRQGTPNRLAEIIHLSGAVSSWDPRRPFSLLRRHRKGHEDALFQGLPHDV